ncbi:MAG: hypothetical protein AAF892_08660 [Cyanobacteria bacterium P01_D01_bin.71]
MNAVANHDLTVKTAFSSVLSRAAKDCGLRRAEWGIKQQFE